MYKIVCQSEFQTKEYAKKLAEILKVGDVLVLSGELGAGKNKIRRRNFGSFWYAR